MILSHATTCLFALALISGARAQSAPDLAEARSRDAKAVLQLEALTVTGSNLARNKQERALPVSVLTTDDFAARDPQTPVDLLSSLPQVVSVPLNETATLGATARGDNSAISLRGLSTGSTLVLLNGRRLAPHPISAAESSVPALSPNVAQLPNRGVAQVEVLRDGASAVYGTDAVAGVVNFLTRRDVRETEITARFGDTTEGGGREWRGTLLTGADLAGGKGRFALMVDLYDREAIFARQRAFASDADHTDRAPPPWNDFSTDSDFFARSSGSAYGNFTVGRINPNGTFTAGRPSGVPAALTSPNGVFFLVPDGTGGVAFQTGTPARTGSQRDYYYNVNADRVIQPKSTRTTLFGSGDYELAPGITGFLDLNYYRALSSTFREPDAYAASTDEQIVVPASNPWNPFGERFFSPTGAPNADGSPRLTGTPSPVRLQNKRFVDLPARIADVDSQVIRGVAGLRGTVGENWSWEAAVLHTEAKTTDLEHFTSRESLLIAAIEQSDPSRAFNPFGHTFAVRNGTLVVNAPYVNPATVTSTFQQPFERHGATSITSGDIRVSGDVLTIWGGNKISAAFGAEQRHETFTDTRPPFAGLNPAGSGLDSMDNDFIAFSPTPDTDAARDVSAGYAEVVVPVVGNGFTLPLVHAFEVSAAGRLERYSDFGTTRKPKIGLAWQFTPEILVRASYNEGFRAPNLAQLFTGELTRSTPSTDTYRAPVTQLPTDLSSNRLERRSGNQFLRPEESRGKSAGIAVDVPFVKGLTFAVDYWEIRQLGLIDNTIGIPDDTLALVEATQAALAQGTAIDQIDLGSGTAAYQGNPAVVRLPVTQQDRDFFAAYNATQAPSDRRAVVGAIEYVRQTYFNKSEQFVNGFDFSVRYKIPETRFGRFTLATEWTKLNSFYEYPTPTEPRDNRLGEDGAAKWRGTASFTWRQASWSGGLSAYYVGRYQDTFASPTATAYNNLGRPSYIAEVFDGGAVRYRYVVADSISYNAHVAYQFRGPADSWLAGTSVRLGLVNVFNAEPPLSSEPRGYDPSVYNTLARGRSWSVELTKKF